MICTHPARSVMGFPVFTLLYIWCNSAALSKAHTGPVGDLCLSLGKFTRSDYKFMVAKPSKPKPPISANGDAGASAALDAKAVDVDEGNGVNATTKEIQLFWYAQYSPLHHTHHLQT